jgi:2-polyprenyl-6-hydroxyphenyl methylase/3-demethylubiquinone-9 3-methyltransferase
MPQPDYRFIPEYAKYDLQSRRDPQSWYRHDYGLQRLERLRFPWFARRLPPLAGLDVLDIGCGGGILAESLARAGAHVVGIDPSRATIRVARAHAKRLGLPITYRVGFAERLKARRAFDLVFAVDVLEHVENLDRTLDAAAAALRPGGWFGFLTHNATLEAFREIIWKWEYASRSAPRGRHDFQKFITPEALRAALRARGLTVRHLSGIRWTPSIALSRSTRVSYLGLARKRT